MRSTGRISALHAMEIDESDDSARRSQTSSKGSYDSAAAAKVYGISKKNPAKVLTSLSKHVNFSPAASKIELQEQWEQIEALEIGKKLFPKVSSATGEKTSNFAAGEKKGETYSESEKEINSEDAEFFKCK